MNCFCENAYKDLKCELGDRCRRWVNDKTGYYLSNKLLNSETIFKDNDIHYICSIGCLYDYTNINYNFYQNMNANDIVSYCSKFIVYRWCCECDIDFDHFCKKQFFKCRECSIKNRTTFYKYISDDCIKENEIRKVLVKDNLDKIRTILNDKAYNTFGDLKNIIIDYI
jgi:hypothetical protein